MANVEEKILDIQVRYDDAIRGIAKYQSAVDAARQHEKDLKKQLEENEISREQYNAEMAATRVTCSVPGKDFHQKPPTDRYSTTQTLPRSFLRHSTPEVGHGTILKTI